MAVSRTYYNTAKDNAHYCNVTGREILPDYYCVTVNDEEHQNCHNVNDKSADTQYEEFDMCSDDRNESLNNQYDLPETDQAEVTSRGDQRCEYKKCRFWKQVKVILVIIAVVVIAAAVTIPTFTVLTKGNMTSYTSIVKLLLKCFLLTLF